MKRARLLAVVAFAGIAGLCQCSLLVDVNGLEPGSDSGTDATGQIPQDGNTADMTSGDELVEEPQVDDGASTTETAVTENGDADAGPADGGGAADRTVPDGMVADADGSGGNAADADASGGNASDAMDADARSVPPPSDGGNSDGDAGNPLDVGLVAYYRFDETSGTIAADATGHGHDATMMGATFAPGLHGNAATLNGNSQYVSIPSSTVASLTSFTVASWTKVVPTSGDAAAMWSRIFDFGSGTAAYMFLSPSTDTGTTRYAITIGGIGSEERLSAPTLQTGTWKHVAITFAGSTGTLYIDGAQAAQNTAMTLDPASLNGAAQCWIGRSQFSGDPYLTGQVDEFRIYNLALSPSEVMQLFQQML